MLRPGDGHLHQLSGLAVVLLAGLTVLRLLIVWWCSPAERLRAVGLLLVLVAQLLIAVAIGLGRTEHGGRASRYVTVAMPTLACLYVSWLLYGRVWARRAVHLGLLGVISLALLPANFEFAVTFGEEHRRYFGLLERGLKDRHPGSQVIRSTQGKLLSDEGLLSNEGMVYEFLRMLKTARIGQFRRFHDDLAARGDVDGDGRVDFIKAAMSRWACRPYVRIVDGAPAGCSSSSSPTSQARRREGCVWRPQTSTATARPTSLPARAGAHRRT